MGVETLLHIIFWRLEFCVTQTRSKFNWYTWPGQPLWFYDVFIGVQYGLVLYLKCKDNMSLNFCVTLFNRSCYLLSGHHMYKLTCSWFILSSSDKQIYKFYAKRFSILLRYKKKHSSTFFWSSAVTTVLTWLYFIHGNALTKWSTVGYLRSDNSLL